MQTEADPRLKSANSDPALFSDDEEDDASTGSVDSNEERVMSLYELLNETLSNFDAAIGSDDAWAWSNFELAEKVFVISIRLQNWKASIFWIASQSAFMAAGTIDNAHAQELLSSLTRERPFLHSLLLSYFDDINARLKNIRDDLSIRTGDEQAEPQKPLLEELDTAVQCICVQLAPISLFAESRPLHQGIPTIKSEQQENAAIRIETEVQTPQEEEPVDYQSQYDWNQKKGKRLRNDFVSSKREFSDSDLGLPSKEEANEKREAQSTGVSYGSDPNYHSSYDWALGKKRFPSIPEWDEHYQTYLRTNWNFTYEREYRERLDRTNGLPGTWVFFDYPHRDSVHNNRGTTSNNLNAGYHTFADASTSGSSQQAGDHQIRKGAPINGTYKTANFNPHETLDPSFKVRHGAFFTEGTVFAVLFTEAAGDPTQVYNSCISTVLYNGLVHTQIRRFVVVASRKKRSYACPIFTYSCQGTKKRGVDPQEHAVAYSQGQNPALLSGEQTLQKNPICIVMANEPKNPPLSAPSRICFGIHHPINHNVKVKHIGQVKDADIPDLLGYWKMENANMLNNPAEAAAEGWASSPVVLQEDPYLYHKQRNPYGYDAQINQHMFHPDHNPSGYHPTKNIHGFHPHSNPHMYHPTHNPNGFHKDNNSFGYHPKKNLHGYHPTHNVYGYHPSHAQFGYHPELNPRGYHAHYNREGYHPVSNKYCYHPEQNPYGYNSQENTMGHHIQLNPYAFHPLYHNAGYHPTHKPLAYHPYHNPTVAQQDESSEEEKKQGDDGDGDDDEDEDDQLIMY